MFNNEPEDYAARVRAYEAEGLTTSDAQGVVDAEIKKAGHTPDGQSTADYLADCYLEYVNNFITVKAFADWKGITEKAAHGIIADGREFHERRAALTRAKGGE